MDDRNSPTLTRRKRLGAVSAPVMGAALLPLAHRWPSTGPEDVLVAHGGLRNDARADVPTFQPETSDVVTRAPGSIDVGPVIRRSNFESASQAAAPTM